MRSPPGRVKEARWMTEEGTDQNHSTMVHRDGVHNLFKDESS